MLFDIRGRRKNVVRVVYAVLALLMGASLFLVVGSFNIGELFGTGSSDSASGVLEEQAERTEARLRANPDDEALLLSLSRTRVAAGNALSEVNPQTGEPAVTPEGRAQLEQATQAWEQYLKAADEPNPSGAQLLAGTYFTLAQTSPTFGEASENVKQAAEAQRIVATARPSVGSFSSLAIYEYFSGNFAAGDKAQAQAQVRTATKEEQEQVAKQLAVVRQNGTRFNKELRQSAKAEQGASKEALQNPFGGLSGGSLGGP
jgi:hypothetical protein